MAYLKPGAITRKIFNPLAMKLGFWNVETLVVQRRKSGEPQSVPVIPLEHEGARYVVSTRGESDWVKNLRAAGAGELRRKGEAQKVRVVGAARRGAAARDRRLPRQGRERGRPVLQEAARPGRPPGLPARVVQTLLTPVSFLERSAAAFPDRIAVVDEERRFTWAELRERARRLALALQRSGIEKDDRVAFLALNTVELLEAHFGVPAAGAVLVAINTRLTADEVAYILDHSGARIVVVDPSLAHLVDGAAVERVLVLGEGGDYEEFLASAGDGEPEDRLESEEDTISINYTSGTTGRPKGVMYTHRGAYLNALSEVVHARLDSGRCTCGRCRCSTATAGASPGP